MIDSVRSGIAGRWALLTGVTAIFLAAMGACTGVNDDLERRDPALTPEPAVRDGAVVAPLVGLPATQAALDHPVIAAKLEHRWPERPQSGLNDADVVFEQRTDGDHVRLLALFQSVLPDSVGPLESARLVDAVVIGSLNGVYVAKATAGEIDRALVRAGIHVVTPDDDPRPFSGTAGGDSPEGVYVNARELAETVSGQVPPATSQWHFANDSPTQVDICPDDSDIECEVVEQEVVTYSVVPDRAVEWRYEADRRRYTRIENGVGHLSPGGERVDFANVVVLDVEIDQRFESCCEDLSIPLGESGLVGSGSARINRDGRQYEARWERDEPLSDLRLVSPQGVPIALRPGRTWFVLLPTNR